jgi:hypothetical protein
MPEIQLSEAGKEQLAIALLLLRDFRVQIADADRFESFLEVRKLAEFLGIAEVFDNTICKIPPLTITERRA